MRNVCNDAAIVNATSAKRTFPRRVRKFVGILLPFSGLSKALLQRNRFFMVNDLKVRDAYSRVTCGSN